MKKLLYISFITFFFSSCLKEKTIEDQLIPESASDTPQLFFNGTIDEDSVSFETNENYIFTSEYYFDSTDNVYYFEGGILEVNCTGCYPVLKIKIANSEHGENFNLPTSIENGELPLADALQPQTITSTVEISYSKNDGNGVYSSKMISQTATANYFEVLSVEQFEENEDGLSTVKIGFDTKCLVSNLNSNKLIDIQGFFAFAHP